MNVSKINSFNNRFYSVQNQNISFGQVKITPSRIIKTGLNTLIIGTAIFYPFYDLSGTARAHKKLINIDNSSIVSVGSIPMPNKFSLNILNDLKLLKR